MRIHPAMPRGPWDAQARREYQLRLDLRAYEQIRRRFPAFAPRSLVRAGYAPG
jgi:hypothetical protein